VQAGILAHWQKAVEPRLLWVQVISLECHERSLAGTAWNAEAEYTGTFWHVICTQKQGHTSRHNSDKKKPTIY